MAITLFASQCPAVQVPSGLPLLADAYSATPSLLEAQTLVAGNPAAIPSRWNLNAQYLELLGRYPCLGLHAVANGLTLSDVSGLTISVAAGHAFIGGIVELAEATQLVVNDASRTFVWLKSDGTLEASGADSTTPPATPAVLLGSVTAAAGDVNATMDYSGVVYLKGARAMRETADPDWPSDSPPAGASVFTKTLNGTWFWDGSNHLRVGGAVAEYGRKSIGLADANYTPSSSEYKYKVLEFTGALTANRNIVLPTVDGATFIINNKTTGGFSLVVKTNAGTGPTVSGKAVVYCDGTNYVQAV